jgi:hypothetical protein
MMFKRSIIVNRLLKCKLRRDCFYAIRHPCAKRCGFVAIGLENTEQRIYNGIERNHKTVGRFETRISRVSDATDVVIVFSKFK